MGYKFNVFSGNFDVTVEFLQKIGTVLSPITTGDSLAIYIAGITVPTDGLLLENTTASTGTAQYSPRIRLKGSGHDGAASVTSEWTIENKPISGATVSSELLISHSLGGAAYTNPITITSGGAIKCSEVLSGLSVTYGDLIFGTATTPTVVSRNTADAYDVLTVNNLNAGSTGKILVGQWQSTDRFWFTKEGYLNISSAMNLGAVATDGLVLGNTSPALVGAKVQMSPGASWIASAWDDDGAVSVQHKWRAEVLPASGNTVSSAWRLGVSVDGGAYIYPYTFTSGGSFTCAGTIIANSSFRLSTGQTFQNLGSADIFTLNVGTATASAYWSRNTADAYTTCVLNNLNAGSTGNILDLQWQSVNRVTFSKEGNLTLTGSLGLTGSRISKGWFTDLEVTNAIVGTISIATNLAGGNSTTLLGSIPYQSDSNTTTLLAPNTTTTRKVLSMTGDGTNGAVPVWSDDVSYWSKASTVLSPATVGDTLDIKKDTIGSTVTDGLVLSNNTSSLVGSATESSPTLRFRAHEKNVVTGLDETHDFTFHNYPTTGNPTVGRFYLYHSLNGGVVTTPFTFTSAGALTMTSGLSCTNVTFSGQIISNASAFYGVISAATDVAPITVTRNWNDAINAFTVNLTAAAATGNIFTAQWQSSDRFIVGKEGGIQSNYCSAIAMGNVPDASTVLTVGWNNSTMAAGTTAARHMLIGGNITELAGAAITDIVGLYINTFTIGAGAGASVGFTAGLYIPNAPTPGSVPTIGNYALFVDAGEVRIDGEIGDTTNRCLKGWFTDLEATSLISTTQYFGDKTTDGSFKMEIESGDLVIYKKETGTWVEKGRYE